MYFNEYCIRSNKSSWQHRHVAGPMSVGSATPLGPNTNGNLIQNGFIQPLSPLLQQVIPHLLEVDLEIQQATTGLELKSELTPRMFNWRRIGEGG